MPSIILRSGLWTGWYQRWLHRAEQSMTLDFADGVMRGFGSDVVGPFRIEGQYRITAELCPVAWIKTYDAAHSILYRGYFDGQSISGDWSFSGDSFRRDGQFSIAYSAADSPGI